MGYNKLLHFFTKNLYNFVKYPNKLNKNYFIISNIIIFDMTFIIYTCINDIEKECNNILKIILSIDNSYNLNIQSELNKIILKNHWKDYYKQIIDLFFNKKTYNLCNEFKLFLSNKIIYDILYKYINNYLEDKLNLLHEPSFIKKVCLFFDGIPIFSKIIEQRRRRIKNYLESNIKKNIYINTFKKLDNNLIEEGLYIYSYSDWINNRITINKNLGSNSVLILNLELFLKNNFKKYNLYINSTSELGEADFKIYNYINKLNNYDVCIHSCDSDFIYFNLLFQLKFNTTNRNINLHLINYAENFYEIINSQKFCKIILDKYKSINKIYEEPTNNILFDLLFIITLCGNDMIPNSLEIGPEIELKTILELHYKVFNNNKYIININSYKTINFDNLLLFLNELIKINSSTILILNRFYKLSNKFVNILTNKLDLPIEKILDNFLIPYNQKNIDLSKFSNDEINILNENINLSNNDNGLKRLEKHIKLEENSYENLYNLTTSNSVKKLKNKILKPFPYNFKNLNELISIKNNSENYDSFNYLETLINYILILFYDFNLYNPYLIFNYKYNLAPNFKNLIYFINNNDMDELQKNIYQKLKVKNNNIYFDDLSHLLLITPFIKKKNKLNYKHTYLLNSFNFHINNIWYDNIDNFNLKNIDYIKFLNVYKYNLYLYSIIKYNFNLLLL